MAQDFLGSEGKTISVTPKTGDAYAGIVRSVHETGVTVWMDGEAKDEGEVRTVHLDGPHADATATIKD